MTIMKKMEKISSYTSANMLHLNPDKTQIMIQSKNKEMKKNFTINLGGKEVNNSSEVNILGNTLIQDLNWDTHVSRNIIPSLRNRVRTMRLVSRYMDKDFKRKYANSIFKSKLMYSLEQWGGTTKTLLKKVQNLQDQMTRLALPKEMKEKSSRQRLHLMDWISVEAEVKRATYIQTFKILNFGTPQELASQMPKNTKSLRISKHNKLDTKPKWLGKNKTSRASYRNRAYEYNTLPSLVTTQTEVKKIKKELKIYQKNRNYQHGY